MATSTELLAELKALGITTEKSGVEGILPLKGDETGLTLSNIFKKAKGIVENAGNGSSNQSNATDTNVKTVLVWVKGRTYINATQRIDGGLYRLSEVPERLVKSSRDVVEVFADGIPPRKLTEIAKWSGVSHPEDYEDDVLLEKIIVSELKPF